MPTNQIIAAAFALAAVTLLALTVRQYRAGRGGRLTLAISGAVTSLVAAGGLAFAT